MTRVITRGGPLVILSGGCDIVSLVTRGQIMGSACLGLCVCVCQLGWSLSAVTVSWVGDSQQGLSAMSVTVSCVGGCQLGR